MIAARWMIAVGETALQQRGDRIRIGEVGPPHLGRRHPVGRFAVGRHVEVGGDDVAAVDHQLSHGFRADQSERPGDQHSLAAWRITLHVDAESAVIRRQRVRLRPLERRLPAAFIWSNNSM